MLNIPQMEVNNPGFELHQHEMQIANFPFVGQIKYYLILWIARLTVNVIYVHYFNAE